MSKRKREKDYSHIYDYFTFTSENDVSPPKASKRSREPIKPVSQGSDVGIRRSRQEPWNGISYDFSTQNTFEPSPPTTTREIHQNRDGTQTAIERISGGNLNEFNTLVNRQFNEAGATRKASERLYDQGQKLNFIANQHQTDIAHQEFTDELNNNTQLARQQMGYAYQIRKDELDSQYADKRNARQHDLAAMRINNSQQLTDDRIRLAQLAFNLKQEALRASDERALALKDKFNINNEILGIKKHNYELTLFKKFGMMPPNNEHEADMQFESDWVVLLDKKKVRSYVRSKLFYGVRSVDANRKKLYFFNGDVVEFKKKPNILYHFEFPTVVNTVIVHEFRTMDVVHRRDCPCSECRVY